MWWYLARRAGFSLAGLLVVSFVVLQLLALAPGDAATVMAGQNASQEALDELRQELNLGRPAWQQWVGFWHGALRGDLGRSLYSGRPVLAEMAERAPYTVGLAGAAMAISLLLGVSAGALAALHRGSRLDLLLMAGANMGLAVPSYWLAVLLVLLFSLHLGWLPVSGAGTPAHMFLPALCLGLPTAAVFARLTRANVLDVLGSDYVLVARAKGLSRRAIMLRHLLRNSLIPTVTVAGLHFGHLLGGTFIVETIFSWPGLGRLTVQSVFNRDWPIIMGTSLAMALVYVVTNLVVDLLYGWLDPRLGQRSV